MASISNYLESGPKKTQTILVSFYRANAYARYCCITGVKFGVNVGKYQYVTKKCPNLCINCLSHIYCYRLSSLNSYILTTVERWRSGVAVARWSRSTHGIAVAFLSVRTPVRPSVCLSNACFVTKRNNLLPKFLYHTKGPFIEFSERKSV